MTQVMFSYFVFVSSPPSTTQHDMGDDISCLPAQTSCSITFTAFFACRTYTYAGPQISAWVNTIDTAFLTPF